MRSSMRIQDDPIMEAYGKCLQVRKTVVFSLLIESSKCLFQENILCTWRRKPLSVSPATLPLPSLIDDNGKELWVFWFNEKPETLDELLSQLSKSFVIEKIIFNICFSCRYNRRRRDDSADVVRRADSLLQVAARGHRTDSSAARLDSVRSMVHSANSLISPTVSCQISSVRFQF